MDCDSSRGQWAREQFSLTRELGCSWVTTLSDNESGGKHSNDRERAAAEIVEEHAGVTWKRRVDIMIL